MQQRDVAPDLKARFNDYIDQRTAKGVETYGGPLRTHNGRDTRRDMMDALLDFCQYQQQRIMELEGENEFLKTQLRNLNGLIEVWYEEDKELRRNLCRRWCCAR